MLEAIQSWQKDGMAFKFPKNYQIEIPHVKKLGEG